MVAGASLMADQASLPELWQGVFQRERPLLVRIAAGMGLVVTVVKNHRKH